MIKRCKTVFIFSLFIFIFSFASCPNPFGFDDHTLPDGMGAFSLSVSSARTILPSAPGMGDFTSLELVFTANPSGVSKTVDINPYYGAAVLPEVLLVVGTYELTVNAYKGAHLAARGTAAVVINAGQRTGASVTLSALLNEPGAAGTFSWSITVPGYVNVSTAQMTISPLSPGGTAEQTVTLNPSGTPLKAEGNRPLNSGLYNVTFNLEETGGKQLVWTELLHVYSALTSDFTMAFEDRHFNNPVYTVTFVFNNGDADASPTVIHGNTIAAPAGVTTKTADAYLYAGAPPATPGYTLAGWWDETGAMWNFSNRIHENKTLTAVWEGPIDVSGSAGNNDAERAVSYVKANAGTAFTLVVNGAVDIAPQTLDTANVKLTIQGLGAGAALNLSGTGTMFTVGATLVSGTGLTLGNNITLDGTVLVYQLNEIKVSGNSNIKELTLIVNNSYNNSSLQIDSGWTGNVSTLNLMGLQATITGANGVISHWVGRPVLTGGGLTGALANTFNSKLGDFIDGVGGTLPISAANPPDAPGGYKIADDGKLAAIETITLDNLAAYLAAHSGGSSAANPVPVPLVDSLGTMTAAGSGWQTLLGILQTAGKYVDLDLSACTIGGTVFNPVSSIATGKDRIVSIDLPPAAVSIAAGTDSNWAFQHFANLVSFSGTGLTTIGDYAFLDCMSLAMTSLPSGLTSIGDWAFAGTSLALDSLPSGLTSIGSYAFSGCMSLALDSLPSGITSISEGTFSECRSLALTSLPSGVTSIGDHAFTNCTNLALTELPSGVTSIGEYAFTNCKSLAWDSLPSGITSIGDWTFYGCTSLALTSLPPGVTSIGEYAFYECTRLALDSLPSGITSIGEGAFSFCESLALDSLPSGITSIGEGAFSECTSLALTELPSGLTSIGNSAFSFCESLALTELPEGLTAIGHYVFIGCTGIALTELPEGLTTIGQYAFSGCTGIDSLTIPAGVTAVGSDAFNGWTFSQTITVLGYASQTAADAAWGAAWRSGCNANISYEGILKSVADVAAYLASHPAGGTAGSPVPLPVSIDLGTMTATGSGWRSLLDAIAASGKYVSLDLSACEMGGTAFNPDSSINTGKDKIVSIALPDTATSIAAGSSGNATFNHFANLTSFSGAALTSIGDYAFEGCTSLAMYSLPEGLTTIGENAFRVCTNLALTTLPSGVTTIANAAFYGCTNLALTELPTGITTINTFAFYGCKSLALTELPDGLTSIGDYAFYECTSLALTELPSGLTSIGTYAFSVCRGIASLTIPTSVTTVGGGAFSAWTASQTIIVPWAEGSRPSGWDSAWSGGSAVINYTP